MNENNYDSKEEFEKSENSLIDAADAEKDENLTCEDVALEETIKLHVEDESNRVGRHNAITPKDVFSEESDAAYSDKVVYGSSQNIRNKKNKAPVTWGALVACMLVMLLGGAAIGAGITYIFTGMPDKNIQSSNDDPGFVVQNDTNIGTTDNPSSKLNLNSDNKVTSDKNSIVESCRNVVVSIEVVIVTNSYYGEQTGTGAGSGVILTPDGYIVTNNHVIDGATAIKVTLMDGTEYEAELIGSDSRTDLAVVKIEANNLPSASIGNSSTVSVGDWVYAIGNATGELDSTLTQGGISGVNRSIEIDGQTMTLLQTDAAINPGNSGGGLFLAETGQLIGIVNAKSFGLEIEGLGFAIPIDTVRDIVTDLMDLGYVSGRPYLGISMQTVSVYTNGYMNPFEQFFGGGTQNAVLVVYVAEGSPANLAGIQTGDYIIKFGDTDIFTSDEFKTQLNNCNAGDTITLTIQRNSQEMQIEVVLGEGSGEA